MEHMNLNEIVKAVLGEIVVKGQFNEYNSVSTDTRNIKNGDIFIAIKGPNFNGNDFVKEASEKGAVICIVDQIEFKKEEIDNNTTIIKVEDTKQALLDLAKYYRSKLDLKVIGITGSTGKTSTKDLLAAALSSKFKVYKTQGNFNNEIGLPLMIFNLDSSYDIAVLEMGMSNFGEIHRMVDASRPDIGIITNIGLSHIENLKTRENIFFSKLEITDYFKKKNILIVNSDDNFLSKVKSDEFKIIKTGIDNRCNIQACNLELNEYGSEFYLIENKKNKGNFQLNIPGKHNVSNMLLAIACARTLGLEYKDIQEGMKKLETTSMRLDIQKGKKFTIVNDCYNASPDSMRVAIDVLKNIKANKRIAIFGTMLELGESSYNEHKKVGEYARSKGIDLLVTLGEFNEAYKEGYKDEHCKNFSNYNELVKYVLDSIEDGDAVLIKASRSMKFETIVDELNNNN